MSWLNKIPKMPGVPDKYQPLCKGLILLAVIFALAMIVMAVLEFVINIIPWLVGLVVVLYLLKEMGDKPK